MIGPTRERSEVPDAGADEEEEAEAEEEAAGPGMPLVTAELLMQATWGQASQDWSERLQTWPVGQAGQTGAEDGQTTQPFAARE